MSKSKYIKISTFFVYVLKRNILISFTYIYIYCNLYTANHYIAARALSAAPSSVLPFLINDLKLIFY